MKRIIAIFLVLAVLALTTPANAGKRNRIDLEDRYPNMAMVEEGFYLEGFNYISGTAQRSVLWFEDLGSGVWRQYNSGPESATSRCHYDEFEWDKKLTYFSTVHSCDGVTAITLYPEGIDLMPRRWREGREWNRSGVTSVVHTVNGVITGTGFNYWQAHIDADQVEIHPGVFAVHVRTNQRTEWDNGFVTLWQEDYYLVDDLPIDGGDTAPAFKRSVGGNSTGIGNWDVWFDRWKEGA